MQEPMIARELLYEHKERRLESRGSQDHKEETHMIVSDHLWRSTEVNMFVGINPSYIGNELPKLNIVYVGS